MIKRKGEYFLIKVGDVGRNQEKKEYQTKSGFVRGLKALNFKLWDRLEDHKRVQFNYGGRSCEAIME